MAKNSNSTLFAIDPNVYNGVRVKCQKLSRLQIKIAGVISYRNNAREGWTMGFEPTTTGTTIRGSTAELRPPYQREVAAQIIHTATRNARQI